MTINRRDLMAGAAAATTGLAVGLPAAAAASAPMPTPTPSPIEKQLLGNIDSAIQILANAKAHLLRAQTDDLGQRLASIYELRSSLGVAQLCLSMATDDTHAPWKEINARFDEKYPRTGRRSRG